MKIAITRFMSLIYILQNRMSSLARNITLKITIKTVISCLATCHHDNAQFHIS